MKFIIVVVMCCIAATAAAGMKAITDEGEVVILNDDGTWHYENKNAVKSSELVVNPTKFTKPGDASFEVKSTVNGSTFWINPKKWAFKKNDKTVEASEFSFRLKNSDLYGMAITEELQIDLVALTDVAFENAKEAAPDVKINKREYRIVNGHKVIYMEMIGTIQGVKFRYLGYYFADQSGSTQYLTYTGNSLVDKYRKDIDDFLNGFSSR